MVRGGEGMEGERRVERKEKVSEQEGRGGGEGEGGERMPSSSIHEGGCCTQLADLVH